MHFEKPTKFGKISVGLLATFLILSSNVFADDSWPQTEVTSNTAGFSEQGLASLDAAMEKIVADQDVAGMIWMLAKDG
jgi:hypothetical protein